MIYSVEQLKQTIAPIARKYNLPVVYLFGSYARGEATEDSDVDLLINYSGSSISTLFDLGALYDELNMQLEKEIDLVTEDSLTQEETLRRTPWFAENLRRERLTVYEKF